MLSEVNDELSGPLRGKPPLLMQAIETDAGVIGMSIQVVQANIFTSS